MMTPLQISSHRFSPSGKGGYKAAEVDEFIQKIYKNYTKLFNDNNTLNERLQSISPVIDEYNKNKAAIANALISAQNAADSKLEEAEQSAKAVVEEAEKKAEAYYVQKTHEADEKLAELQRNYTKLKTDSDAYKEKYFADVKVKANEIISEANEKAASIVAKAYDDAKTARERADKIIDEANEELKKIKAEAAKIKAELAGLIALANSVNEGISDFEPIEKKSEAESEAEETVAPVELPDFELSLSEQLKEETEDADNEDEVITVYDKKDFASANPEDEVTDLFSNSADAKAHQKSEIPDAEAYLAQIFGSVGNGDSDFGFDDLISES